MHELRALVEESGVVFVAFDDEGPSLAQMKTGSEVFRDAPDEERRRKLRVVARGNFINPGEHAGRCGFAVGPGDHQRLMTGDEFLMNDAGQRGERNAPVEHALPLRRLPRDRALPTMIRSGAGSRFASAERLGDGNAETAQQVRHGRIGGLIRPGDAMPFQLQQSCERCHRRAADSDEMDVFPSLHVSRRRRLARDNVTAADRCRG